MPDKLKPLKCRLFGHKWIPVYIVCKEGRCKFVATYCTRCLFGRDDLMQAIQGSDVINTYESKYYLQAEVDNGQA